jgi:hypothetical protein
MIYEATSTMMIANLTLDFSQDYEAIVDMDDFAGLLKSIDCSAPDLYLEFKDEKSFAYAHQVWDWVNSVSTSNSNISNTYRCILQATQKERRF